MGPNGGPIPGLQIGADTIIGNAEAASWVEPEDVEIERASALAVSNTHPLRGSPLLAVRRYRPSERVLNNQTGCQSVFHRLTEGYETTTRRRLRMSSRLGWPLRHCGVALWQNAEEVKPWSF